MSKRLFDIIFSSLILLLATPVILTLILIILVIDKHSPFFIQERSGLNFKSFKIYKLKSMKYDSFSGKPIITSIGKFIRIVKIDEILQFINVLKNEMSIIGPRPLYMDFNNHYKDIHRCRAKVKPGITGLAQVKVRNSTAWHKKFNFDVIYVKNLNWKLDLYILLRTFVIIINSAIFRKNRAIESLDYKDDFFKNYVT